MFYLEHPYFEIIPGMRKLLIAFLFLPSLFLAAQKKTDPQTFAKTIASDDLKKQLYIIASKEMEGRETATPGQKKSGRLH